MHDISLRTDKRRHYIVVSITIQITNERLGVRVLSSCVFVESLSYGKRRPYYTMHSFRVTTNIVTVGILGVRLVRFRLHANLFEALYTVGSFNKYGPMRQSRSRGRTGAGTLSLFVFGSLAPDGALACAKMCW